MIDTTIITIICVSQIAFVIIGYCAYASLSNRIDHAKRAARAAHSRIDRWKTNWQKQSGARLPDPTDLWQASEKNEPIGRGTDARKPGI